MGLVDILLQPDKRPEYSVWNPNAQDPPDPLDRALFHADKAILGLEQAIRERAVSSQDVARASITIAKAIRRASEELRDDSRSNARWQLANFFISMRALIVSAVGVWVAYVKP